MALEVSLEEAEARFDEAAEAAARGERVVIIKDGVPFVEMVRAVERNPSSRGERE